MIHNNEEESWRLQESEENSYTEWINTLNIWICAQIQVTDRTNVDNTRNTKHIWHIFLENDWNQNLIMKKVVVNFSFEYCQYLSSNNSFENFHIWKSEGIKCSFQTRSGFGPAPVWPAEGEAADLLSQTGSILSANQPYICTFLIVSISLPDSLRSPCWRP